ncbi:MAG: 3-deoxy-7-phosphoheptulonate synthase [Patescibacteria group bacterium]|nr:3-deoxy-7-phosphoheptulonate synthase [Patescibacteria group bacterium]
MNRFVSIFRSPTDGLRTKEVKILPSPRAIRKKYPLNPDLDRQILGFRETIKNILDGRDPRFLAIVGPCSVHNEAAVLEYAGRLLKLADRYQSKIFVVIRLCFEKPRTETGWEGAANDWTGDGTCNLAMSMEKSRHLLWKIVKLGLPVAAEALDQVSEQYFSDLLSAAWLGARNAETTTLRRMASAMSMPVGIKNATSGDIGSAVNAIKYIAKSGRAFPGPALNGRVAEIHATGNLDTFLILRGGKRSDYCAGEVEAMEKILREGNVDEQIIKAAANIFSGAIRTNYHPEEIDRAIACYKKAGLRAAVVVDASHGNSLKEHKRQIDVWKAVVQQRCDGNSAIIGGMLESYLKGGAQKHQGQRFSEMDPEISVTDSCLSFAETEEVLDWTYEKMR